jgi:serine beta-lactamase-like protein LACTB, mitochondrial
MRSPLGTILTERLRRPCFAIAVCLSILPFVHAQNGKLPDDTRTRIEAAVAKAMNGGAPGVAIAVVEDGDYEWSKGFGMADLENGVPATPQTLFRLASVSKPITAVAAMQLSERGKLDLDAPVQRYCPAFPEKSKPITTRELLGHRAGIRHYRSDNDDEINNTKHFEDPIAGGLQFFANDPLVAEPGTKFSYSTQGFTVVGCAIQGASGEPYTDFVTSNVFQPAGMTSTRWDDRFAIIPHRTSFYSKRKTGTLQNADFLDSSYKIPGGGWLSSAEDMARFEVAILNDRLLKPATQSAMWTPQKPTADENGRGRDYALGWGVSTVDGAKDVAHDGGQQGTSTSIILVPDRRKGVVVLMNMDGANASDLAREIMTILLSR